MAISESEMSLLRWPSWLGVVCADLQAQRGYYRDVLGMRETAASDSWVQFDLGDGRTFELVSVSREATQYDRVRYQPGFDVTDIQLARQELVQRGVEVVTEIEGNSDGGSSWCYFRDPEGNVFEITQRQPAG
jgi:catechol 2,3-dioxygenase-like lactoylglutathione lyase family enzyme